MADTDPVDSTPSTRANSVKDGRGFSTTGQRSGFGHHSLFNRFRDGWRQLGSSAADSKTTYLDKMREAQLHESEERYSEALEAYAESARSFLSVPRSEDLRRTVGALLEQCLDRVGENIVTANSRDPILMHTADQLFDGESFALAALLYDHALRGLRTSTSPSPIVRMQIDKIADRLGTIEKEL